MTQSLCPPFVLCADRATLIGVSSPNYALDVLSKINCNQIYIDGVPITSAL